jgi:hypothetical protein
MSSVTSCNGRGCAAVDTAVGSSAAQKKMPATMNSDAEPTSPAATIIWPAMIDA